MDVAKEMRGTNFSHRATAPCTSCFGLKMPSGYEMSEVKKGKLIVGHGEATVTQITHWL